MEFLKPKTSRKTWCLWLNDAMFWQWQWIWTAMSLDWHMTGNAFVHKCLGIDIGLAMDWNRIGIRLVMDWHLIDIGLAIDWYNIVNGLVPKLCVMGGLLGLDWNWIDLQLHWVGTCDEDWHPNYFLLLRLYWHWIGIRLTMVWQSIGRGLA